MAPHEGLVLAAVRAAAAVVRRPVGAELERTEATLGGWKLPTRGGAVS